MLQNMAHRLITSILDVFEASETEEKVYRLKLERAGCPNIFTCKVCLSPDGEEYYSKGYEPQLCVIAAGRVLCSGNKKVRNTPKTIAKIGYLENSFFLAGTLEEVSRLLQSEEFSAYEVKQIPCGIEVIRKPPKSEQLEA